MMQRLLQFTLDLFERPDSAARRAAPAMPPAKNIRPRLQPLESKPNRPLVLESTAFNAIKKESIEEVTALVCSATQPVQMLAQALAPVTFRHPRAVRETMLGPVLVAYAFRRSKRHSIGLTVGCDGLTVAAPSWAPMHEVDKAVLEKSAWILKKLHDMRSQEQQLVDKRVEWANGCTFAYLGQPVAVLLDACGDQGGTSAVLHTQSDEQTLQLHIRLPQTATPEQIKAAMQVWMMRQAQQIFTERLMYFSPLVGVQYKRLSLSSARTRWGSASADGSIRLNWRLMHLRLPIVDYVVVHELSHLRVMDHSPRFWDTVRAVVPDYAELRRQLRTDTPSPW